MTRIELRCARMDNDQPSNVSPDRIGPHELYIGDCVEVMKSFPPDTFHGCVTDPPYGIGFLGREWDATTPGPEFAAELMRVLKPGAHAVLFAATRTLHRLAVALEDADFEIRDVIHWAFFSGFPKSLCASRAIDAHLGSDREVIGQRLTVAARTDEGFNSTPRGGVPIDITKPASEEALAWEGWATSLKPAIEPAILVRKPLDGTVANNLLTYGCGALNIDACRFGNGSAAWLGPSGGDWESAGHVGPWVVGGREGTEGPPVRQSHPLGRWPANLYYCPKPSTAEREAGCEHLSKRAAPDREDNPFARLSPAGTRGNDHPTVKPRGLMNWILRLVSPPGSRILEPFAGSGSTVIAGHGLDLSITAIEIDPDYGEIIRSRWSHADRQMLLDFGP